MVNGLLVEELPRHRRRRLHRADGGAARPGRGGRGRLGQAARATSTTPFKIDLEKAEIEMRDVKREEIPTDAGLREVRQADGHQVGPQRPLPRLLRATPSAATPRSSSRNADGTSEMVPRRRPPTRSAPTCGAPMVIKRGRFGEFLACSRYPECKTTKPDLARRRPARSRAAAASSPRSARGAARCSSAARTTRRPSATSSRGIARCPQPCPKCGAKFVVQKVSKAGDAHPLPQRGLRLHRRPGERRGGGRAEAPAPSRAPPPTRRVVELAATGRAEPTRRRPRSLRASVATASTWRVCGNMSNGCTRRQV